MRYYSVICGLLVLMLVSCKDDSIPVQARSFIDQYFPHSSVVLVENVPVLSASAVLRSISSRRASAVGAADI